MTAKPNFVFVDVTERPKQNSIAIKRQRLIEGLTKQPTAVLQYAVGQCSPGIWFWEDGSGKFAPRGSAAQCQRTQSLRAARSASISQYGWNAVADTSAHNPALP